MSELTDRVTDRVLARLQFRATCTCARESGSGCRDVVSEIGVTQRHVLSKDEGQPQSGLPASLLRPGSLSLSSVVIGYSILGDAEKRVNFSEPFANLFTQIDPCVSCRGLEESRALLLHQPGQSDLGRHCPSLLRCEHRSRCIYAIVNWPSAPAA